MLVSGFAVSSWGVKVGFKNVHFLLSHRWGHFPWFVDVVMSELHKTFPITCWLSIGRSESSTYIQLWQVMLSSTQRKILIYPIFFTLKLYISSYETYPPTLKETLLDSAPQFKILKIRMSVYSVMVFIVSNKIIKSKRISVGIGMSISAKENWFCTRTFNLKQVIVFVTYQCQAGYYLEFSDSA